MVRGAISEVRGGMSMKLMHNSAIEKKRVLKMSDLHFLCGEVMFLGLFWRRKWWNQFNSCVYKYRILGMYVDYTVLC